MKSLFFLVFSSMALQVAAQVSTIDVIGMHQLIDESKSEYTKQVVARNQQAVNTANEQANLSLLVKVKNVYRTLQSRYNTLGTAINIAQIGIDASPMVRHIIDYQGQIAAIASKNPQVAFLGYKAEIEFVGKAQALIGYITGLTLSLGDVNQMKASDRRLLFDYVLSELSSIQNLAGNMLALLRYGNLSAVLQALNPFQAYVNQDKAIVNSILNNAKYLK